MPSNFDPMASEVRDVDAGDLLDEAESDVISSPAPSSSSNFFAGLPVLRIVQPNTARASISPDSLAELCGSALYYAQRGWPVFPVVPARMNGGGGKVPRVKEWQRCASTSSDQIIAWWREKPTSNVGVLCGPRSGLLVVDLDVKPDRGIDGRAALAALEAVHGPLPLGPRVGRGSGSLHIYFAYDPRLGNSVGNIPGIDVRAAGGFVVGALSFHASSGDRYLWVDGTADLRLPPIPEWFIDALLRPTSATKPKKKPRVANQPVTTTLPSSAVEQQEIDRALDKHDYANARATMRTGAGHRHDQGSGSTQHICL